VTRPDFTLRESLDEASGEARQPFPRPAEHARAAFDHLLDDWFAGKKRLG
jgi:hypothetical protein